MPMDILKTPTGFLKLWEIALTLIMVSVTQGVKDFIYGNEHRMIFCGGVLVMGMVVTPIILGSYLWGSAREMQRAPFEMVFNAVMAVFMVSAGAVIIDTAFDYDEHHMSTQAGAGKAAGTFGIVNGVFYGLDTFFAKQNMK